MIDAAATVRTTRTLCVLVSTAQKSASSTKTHARNSRNVRA